MREDFHNKQTNNLASNRREVKASRKYLKCSDKVAAYNSPYRTLTTSNSLVVFNTQPQLHWKELIHEVHYSSNIEATREINEETDIILHSGDKIHIPINRAKLKRQPICNQKSFDEKLT